MLLDTSRAVTVFVFVICATITKENPMPTQQVPNVTQSKCFGLLWSHDLKVTPPISAFVYAGCNFPLLWPLWSHDLNIYHMTWTGVTTRLLSALVYAGCNLARVLFLIWQLLLWAAQFAPCSATQQRGIFLGFQHERKEEKKSRIFCKNKVLYTTPAVKDISNDESNNEQSVTDLPFLILSGQAAFDLWKIKGKWEKADRVGYQGLQHT